MNTYDVIIIGGGPAGLSAAIRASSEGFRCLVLEKDQLGGQARNAFHIENYLGFADGVSGDELFEEARVQIEKFGGRISFQEVVELKEICRYKQVVAKDSKGIYHFYRAKAVIVSVGMSFCDIDIPGLRDLLGRGCKYGADRYDLDDVAHNDVVIIGGGNSAGQAALHMSMMPGSRVMLVSRGRLKDRMASYLVKRLRRKPNITIFDRSVVASVTGSYRLEKVEIADDSGNHLSMPVDRLYIFAGFRPRTEWLSRLLTIADDGRIMPSKDARHEFATGIDGVFVVGDCRCGSLGGVADAVGEGAKAASILHQYFNEKVQIGAK